MSIKQKRSSHRNTSGKVFWEHDENTLAHNQSIPEGYAKFLITSIFATRALNWNCYNTDIHCPGIYIIWDLQNINLYQVTKIFKEIYIPTIAKSVSKSISNHIPTLRIKTKPVASANKIRQKKFKKPWEVIMNSFILMIILRNESKCQMKKSSLSFCHRVIWMVLQTRKSKIIQR